MALRAPNGYDVVRLRDRRSCANHRRRPRDRLECSRTPRRRRLSRVRTIRLFLLRRRRLARAPVGWMARSRSRIRIRIERVAARSHVSRNEPHSHLGDCVDARDVVSGDYATVSDDKRFVSFGYARGRRRGTARRRTGADRMMGDASVWSSLLTLDLSERDGLRAHKSRRME